VEGCMPSNDPGLANIDALEKKLGIQTNDQVPLE
jgi:hypothetical protein